MKTLVAALAASALLFAAAPADGQTANRHSNYWEKKVECTRRAGAMSFGIHWIKRNRWINECIKGKHPG